MKIHGTSYMNLEDVDLFYIPLMNVTRKNFESQLETLYILDVYEVEKDYLLTMDEINLEQIVAQENIDIILYDHNFPNPRQ